MSGPCYYPGGGRWYAAQARLSARRSDGAAALVEAAGAATAHQVAEHYRCRAEEGDELLEPEQGGGGAAGLVVRGSNRPTLAAPPRKAPAAPAASAAPAAAPSTAGADAPEEEDLWGEAREAPLRRAEPRHPEPVAPRSATRAEAELAQLERHQRAVQAELAQSAARTQAMEAALWQGQRGAVDALLPAPAWPQPPAAAPLKSPPAAAPSSPRQAAPPKPPPKPPAHLPPGAGQGAFLTLSDRFDGKRRFQHPSPTPHPAEAQLNMPSSASTEGWVQWPAQRGGEAAPQRESRLQLTGGGGPPPPTGMCREIAPGEGSHREALWWVQPD